MERFVDNDLSYIEIIDMEDEEDWEEYPEEEE